MDKTLTPYQQKLLDPRWQKKRLEILNRDEFTCEICKSTEHPLNVHHKFYTYGLDPWEYPDTNFITLCNYCHEDEHAYKDQFNGIVQNLLLMGHTYTSLYNIFSEKQNILIY